MNAHVTIANRLPDLAEATERANKWVNDARPIIKAMFAIEEADWQFRELPDRTRREAVHITSAATRELHAMLDGIRDDFLCDECPPQPSQDADEQVWQDRDEFNDALGESVTTVEQAIKIVTDEHNRSFGL